MRAGSLPLAASAINVVVPARTIANSARFKGGDIHGWVFWQLHCGFGFASTNHLKSLGWFSMDLLAFRMLSVSH